MHDTSFVMEGRYALQAPYVWMSWFRGLRLAEIKVWWGRVPG